MGEYVAPYKSLTEGFVTRPPVPVGTGSPTKYYSIEVADLTASSSLPTVDTTGNSVFILNDMILAEEQTAADLMKTLKNIQPLAQKVLSQPDAYDAAFETDVNVGRPSSKATLQGFAIMLLLLSYLVLTVVVTLSVSYSTNDTYTTGKVFVGFIFLGVVLFSILARLG